MALAAPLLSAFDPEVSAEGGVDPFSFAATYERLAERIFPFVTVRMSRPRFITAMAAAAIVYDEYRDELASDGKTPPWLVFEWHVIEALFRAAGERTSDEVWGTRIPGVWKVRSAVESGRSVGADAYLKTPKIFGFTGIYRRLAYGLQILDEDLRIDEGAHELLAAWEADRGLDGFTRNTGSGRAFRQDVHSAIRQAMKKGCTCQPKSWSGWLQIAENFRPDGARKREAAVLARRLQRKDLRQNPQDPLATEMRAEIFNEIEKNGGVEDEPRFLRSMRRRSTEAMADRLDAIEAFEAVCALVMDAFDRIRYISTHEGVVTPQKFATAKHGRRPSQIIAVLPSALSRMKDTLDPVQFASQITQLLGRYGDVRTANDLFTAIIDHHEFAQRQKPPDGKRSWFDRDERGVYVRPPYRLSKEPAPWVYVHPYRTVSASRFLRDLGRITA